MASSVREARTVAGDSSKVPYMRRAEADHCESLGAPGRSKAKSGPSDGNNGSGHQLSPALLVGVPCRTWLMAVMMVLADPSIAWATGLDGLRS
jgi:hypothetical protein